MPTHTDSDLLREEDWETENIAVEGAITMYCMYENVKRHSYIIDYANDYANVCVLLISSFQVTSITQRGRECYFQN